MHILIIKLGAMGDVLRTTSLLPALKERYPQAHIDWVTMANAVPLIENNPLIANIHEFTPGLELAQQYNLVINFDDDEDACTLASAVQKDALVGAFVQDGKRTYTSDSADWFDMGLISRFGKEKADQLKAANTKTYHKIHFDILGLRNEQLHQTELHLDRDSIEFGTTFAEKNNVTAEDLVIGLNTGAGGRWQDKRLPLDKTVELIKRIQTQYPQAKLLLFGGPEEAERNGQILSQTEGLIDAGTDNELLDFAGLVNLCTVLITSDSLAMHIGIALKKKVIAFFYPTSAAEIELYGRGEKIIAQGNSYCSYEQPTCAHPPMWNMDVFIVALQKVTNK